MKIFLCYVFFILPFILIKAQADTTSFQNKLNDLLEDATTDKEGVEYYDLVEYLLQNKIVINKSSIKELMVIPNVDRLTAAAIIRHRNLLGGLNSEEQLRAIEGISPELIEQIIPFLIFGDTKKFSFFDSIQKSFEDINISIRSRTINDLQKEKAFKENKYYGSDFKFYNRLIISKEKTIRLGILTEKDPGEQSLTDFTTFHIAIKESGMINNLVLGDFLIEFGQGLALWSRYSAGKGIETIKILPRSSNGIIPYLSSDENLFLRGIAADFNFANFNFSAFASSRLLDGNIDPVTNKISSIKLDGLHRDSSEVAHKRIIKENLFGITAEYNFGEIGNFGLLFTNFSYGNEFEHQSLLDPAGNNFSFISTSYNISFNKVGFNGETSYNGKSFATINNVDFSIDKNFAVLFSYRNYATEYWNLHSNGFGEKDGTQNEIGFYTGLYLKTDLGSLSFYYDQFKFPIASDKFPFPSKGNGFLIYYSFKPNINLEMRLKYINKLKETVTTIENQFVLTNLRSQNIRAELQYKLSKYIQMKSRIEFVNIAPSSSQPEEKGFLIFQDIKYSPATYLAFNGRIIFFRSDSYNSRLYEFENDLVGVMTNPALYGEGIRWYFTARYNTNFGLTLSMKYSELFKPNEKFLGSGDSMINGNLDNRLSFQLDFQL